MTSQLLKHLHWLLLGGAITSAAHAAVYPLPSPDTDVIGEVKVAYATKEDTLLDIARTHSLGYDEIVHANPGVDRWAPGEGTPIVLPTRYILPDTPREGLVLNIAELRLYYYPPAGANGERVVHTYPVSIGRMDWKTPMGLTKVVAKQVDPPWRPPASIKAEHAKEGDILPDVVPGGPDNPLGRYAMRLGLPGYLIHSTNKPFGIGMRVTHGCVRMYPEDIEGLFGMVAVDTSVRLIDQPVKVGRINGELLMEIHEPLEEDNLPIKVTMEQVQKAVTTKLGPDMPGVVPGSLRTALEQISGIPVSISSQAGAEQAGMIATMPPVQPSPVYPPSQVYPPAAAQAAPPRPVAPYPVATQAPPRADAPYAAPTQAAPIRPVTAPPAATASVASRPIAVEPAPAQTPYPVAPQAAPIRPVTTPYTAAAVQAPPPPAAYPRPAYNNWPATAPAYRPAPPAAARAPVAYDTPAVANYEELPYPPGAASPAYQAAPLNPASYPQNTVPLDQPAVSSQPSGYPQEPPAIR